MKHATVENRAQVEAGIEDILADLLDDQARERASRGMTQLEMFTVWVGCCIFY